MLARCWPWLHKKGYLLLNDKENVTHPSYNTSSVAAYAKLCNVNSVGLFIIMFSG